jgi:hypothetical protein
VNVYDGGHVVDSYCMSNIDERIGVRINPRELYYNTNAMNIFSKKGNNLLKKKQK